MIEKLYELGCLNIEKLILKYPQELGINNDEVIILLKLIDVLSKGEKVKESSLAKSTNFDELFVSNTLAKLMELNIIGFGFDIKNGLGEGKYNIDPLFSQLENIIKNDTNKADNTDKIIEFLESKLLRTLSPTEMDRVLEWKEEDINLSDVERACKKVEDKGYTITVLRIEKSIFGQDTTKKSTSRISDLLGK